MSKMIQLRHVPEELHRKLKARAAIEGLSLSDYLLQEVERIAERPTLNDLRRRLASRESVAPRIPPAKAVRRARAQVIVIDASAILELLLNSPASGRVAERLFARNDTLHAPHLLDLEVAQVLRRYTLAGEMEAERSEQALEDLADLRLIATLTTFFSLESGRCGAT